MRLFVGINFPKKQRVKMHRAARALRDCDLPVQWVEPEDFHVTLKSLGQVRREQLSDVTAALEKVAAVTRPFNTQIRGFGAFPTVRRPDEIWLGVEACPEMRCLKQDLEWSLGDVGFTSASRSFHPHITLGRARNEGGVGAFRNLDQVFSELDFDELVKVGAIDLIRSHVSTGVNQYSVVSSITLRNK
ncbi:MAG: RNA 2',3'-cyclic phosphodiesterase [Myxococcales bacterium]|jgi:2'-5' RNA ligase|nr:RNA 2',3'-cyclic phosphodiesterase [Myxococcales bacterium]|tara:strand:+ start:2176 stop:2739 length:564 start_codon:yes stop_codon:yes gene_type:complete